MDKNDSDFEAVMSLTHILRYPRQHIFTFWDTDFSYIVISNKEEGGSTLRTGQLKCAKPAIITPDTFFETFRGFSDEAVAFAAERYGEIISRLRILGYQFTNQLAREEEYNENLAQVSSRVLRDIAENDQKTAVLTAPGQLWNSALLKITFDIIRKSVRGNLQDLEERGFFLTDKEKIQNEIEYLFAEAKENRNVIDTLARTLQDYDLFEEYEERFFKLIH